MRRPEGYKLIAEETTEELQATVNEAIYDGWDPLGAPIVVQDGHNKFFVQAMLKEAMPGMSRSYAHNRASRAAQVRSSEASACQPPPTPKYDDTPWHHQ